MVWNDEVVESEGSLVTPVIQEIAFTQSLMDLRGRMLKRTRSNGGHEAINDESENMWLGTNAIGMEEGSSVMRNGW